MNRPSEAGKSGSGGTQAKTFEKLKKAYAREPLISYEKRKDILRSIENILLQNDEAICVAINKDFGGRSFHETKMLEIIPAVLGIRFTLKHFKRWMKIRKRKVPLVFPGGKNIVMPQAKGIVGIIVPWNYPLFLAVSPLTSALAAGNRVMIKTAPNSTNLTRLLQKLFKGKIPEDYISILSAENPAGFSALPFDHLLFTGSQRVGRIVMCAASGNLTPVTLELGGKSPCILAEDFNLGTAAGRIMYSKLINSGQTCISPDYMFVPEKKADDFIKTAASIAAKRYPDIMSKDYTSIIDAGTHKRLTDTLADAKKKGAEIIELIPGAKPDLKKKRIPPVIVKNVTEKMRIMQEEIFGPYLPVMTYKNIDEVIDYVNGHDRPLALYLYTNDKALQKKVLASTISGGVTINDCTMHIAQNDLPFGGTGNSGMGQYHGYEGFLELSKMKPVFVQSRLAVPLAPPYGKLIDRIYSNIKKIRLLS